MISDTTPQADRPRTSTQNSQSCRHLQVDHDFGSLCLDCGEDVMPLYWGGTEEEWREHLFTVHLG